MQKSITTQTHLFVSNTNLDHPILRSLDDTETLLDWTELEHLLSSICSSKMGHPSYPLLTLSHSLLLSIWFQLSDVQLAQCLYWNSSFRKFCHLKLGGEVPEVSTLNCFRQQLIEHDLWNRLLVEVNNQLETKKIIITRGRINIMDATPFETVQSESGNGTNGKPTPDSKADWHVKNDSRGIKKSIYGFSVHTGVDEDDFIHRQSVTHDNVHDSPERDTLLPGDKTDLYADVA